MTTSAIITEKSGHKGYITLNRPEAHNTFSTEFALLLNKALEDFDKDDEIRVVIIRNNGKNFSTGIDLRELETVEDSKLLEFISLMDRHNHTIANMKKPVLSSVKGYCVANGAGLSFACDMTVAAESARFGTTAVNIGLICTGPGIPLIANVGRKKAMEMVLLGELLSAQQAHELGLVNWVVADDELDLKTEEIADKLASKSPFAVSAGKRGLSAAYDLGYHASIDNGSKVFAALCATEDAAEGIRAFLEKRKAEWKLR
ncbi:enoyl-CoA hydratase/isomerase family protein [Seleniivibrio woodruffii]|uniref:enoyl-CoA hydratase/isomerase family protein n=1 Tax=Seleniivibrio woodruffii TaxID=1078050 RepID=UPI0039E6A9FB